MSGRSARREGSRRERGLWAYNLRILLGNSYWLIVTPVAAAQLVLFWNMATSSLFSAVRAAQTMEELAPILGAFLCAHVLAPEQAGVRELVFARPVSLEKILLVRLGVMLAFVLAVLAPALVLYQLGIKAFPLGLTVAAGLPSLLFLSLLAMAVATSTRHPLLGLGVAAAYWVLDLAAGTYLNPVLTLHGFSDHLAEQPMSDQWVAGKLLLVGLAGLLYVWNRRVLRRPPGPRRWVTAAGVGAAALALTLLYFGSGAAYKITYGMRHERELGTRAYLWYRQQFQGYGPLPVARLFGPAFALYASGSAPTVSTSWVGTPFATAGEMGSLRQLVARYPRSIWADNAAFELARGVGREPGAQVWAVSVYGMDPQAGGTEVVTEDCEGAIEAFQGFADSYPDSPFAPIALGQQAALAASLLDFEAAMGSYERLIREHPGARESREAGLALCAVYLKQGRWKEALHAADAAAEAAPWELRPEALLAAARAAERGGDGKGARVRYEQAHAAAQETRSIAMQARRRRAEIAGGQIVLRADAVMRACEEALASGLRDFTPSPPPPGVTATARLSGEGRGAAGVRAIIATEFDARGRPSPFLDSPAAYGTTGRDGSLSLRNVQPGSYGVAGFAYPRPRGGSPWRVNRPSLPLQVGGSPAALPAEALAAGPIPVGRQPRGGGAVQEGRTPTVRGDRGGRGGGGARRPSDTGRSGGGRGSGRR